jgi:hypothetical protein
MSHNRPGPRFIDIQVTATHTEENRLARRLFQLENRVDELEHRVEEMEAKLDFLMFLEGLSDNSDDEDDGISFCTCDEDED